mmetsp:Transcript_129167/g.257880  ORF Transcript_129167/g.257880 Transcript_129167/m.257880 type:complete len:666 (-) Transcript_129167:26-2023(-)
MESTEMPHESATDQQPVGTLPPNGQNVVADRNATGPPEVTDCMPAPLNEEVATDSESASRPTQVATDSDSPSRPTQDDSTKSSFARGVTPLESDGSERATPSQVAKKLSRKYYNRHQTQFFVRSMSVGLTGAMRRAKLMKSLLSHYYVIYTLYLASVTLIGAMALLACQEDELSFINSLYLAISAVTMTGLSPVDFTALSWYTHLVVWFVIVLGSPMLLSIVPVGLRRWSFRSLNLKKRECESDEVSERQRRETRKFGAAFWGLMTTEDDEYLALNMIFWIVLTYWTSVQVMGWVLLWIALRLSDGVNRPFHAAFLATSAFHNAGLTTLEELPKDAFVLIVVMFLILAGNTCFPLFLRLSIWAFRHASRRNQRRHAVLHMLMKYPRTCYTHLFPAYATRWLTIVTPLLIIFQIAALCVSDLSGGERMTIMDGLETGERVLATIFQSVSTRTAGFSIVPLSRLSTASAFVFCVCMWISSCPVVSIIRATIRVKGQVYQTYYDGSLKEQQSRDASEVKDQLRGFMGQDAVHLMLLFYGILVFEQYIRKDMLDHLEIVFEFCSAYGTVGLSMTSTARAVSASWFWPAKVCILLVMFLGRLRGLPRSIDPAVQFQQYRRLEVGAQTIVHFESSSGLPSIGEDGEESESSSKYSCPRLRNQNILVSKEEE